MIVSELIEVLKTYDQGAIVQCLHHDSTGSYYEQGGTCDDIDLTADCLEYTDWRDNKFIHPDDNWYRKRYLMIGVSD